MKTLDEFLDEIEKPDRTMSISVGNSEPVEFPMTDPLKLKAAKIIRALELALLHYMEPSFCDDGYEARHALIEIDKILNGEEGL